MVLVVRVQLYREALEQMLRDEPRISIVAALATAGDVFAAIAAADPELILMDMSTAGSTSVVERITQIRAPPRVVALGIDETELSVIDAAEAGVEAFVHVGAGLPDLIATVEGAARGELVCSPRIAAILRRRVASMARSSKRTSSFSLTAREHDIASLLREGLSNREIAERLNIEYSTVKNHVHNVLEKLRVSHRWEVAARVHEIARLE